MSNELEKFFLRIIEDPDFRDIFCSATSVEEGYKLALPYIDGVSFEEFKKGLHDIQNKSKHKQKISNEKLKKVLGGTDLLDNALKILSSYSSKEEFLSQVH